MNEHREPFEGELQQLLAVDASTNLENRIRARVFAKPNGRLTWVVWSSAFVTAMAAIVLAVISIQPTQKPTQVEKVSPLPPTTQVVSSQAAEPAGKPALPRRSTMKKPNHVPDRPVVPQAVLAPTSTSLRRTDMEVPTITRLELTGMITPIPEPATFSIARLSPIKIDPPVLIIESLE
jgi:hypothetical protein